MRPPCQDGVTVANGLLYWWPSVCDCNLTLYGLTALGRAGEFQFGRRATEDERLERGNDVHRVAPLEQGVEDWPTFRANNVGSATTSAAVAEKASAIWETVVGKDVTLTAPADRRIPVYGKLMSTWPAASGVLVQDGMAYVAAGIANYDGTHVYALDAATGAIRWQNNTSGHLNAEAHSGVGVQGHMLILGDKLVMAGGNAVSPAVYDLRTGRCLNDPAKVQNVVDNNVPAALSPRGWELYQIGDGVVCCGKPFYAHPEYPVYDESVFSKTLLTTAGDVDVTWVNNAKVICYPRVTENRARTYLAGWGKFRVPGLEPQWQYDCPESAAAAVCRNAVVVADTLHATAVGITNGRVLWRQPLTAGCVPWGMAVDRSGRVILTLKDGRVVCLGDR
ncbi:MAG TPA: PQQ-binding-like beta-propeller repeat protein [Anaerohalosphaeraceae bacterium]|jgi:hypothetical protein|nr:PQQ-binding-like beta-propeller repeat protein [Anaerohalosphaeraceae bacterium]HRT85826.1 PQQ-binding-like beta-propeller repeat protein [Anaerohalosphaeraceae bacterium]